MNKRTKIICTIGPAVNSLDLVIQLMRAGMDVARLNFSHGSHEEHLERIEMLKEARNQLGKPLAIMLDTRGPELRIGKLREEITLHTGQKWHLLRDEIIGDEEKVSFTPPHVLESLQKGTKVLFNDGYISSVITEVNEKGVIVELENGGKISSGKGVNIPNVSLDLPAITEKDKNDIRFGCANDVDIIAASFIRTTDNVITIKNLLVEEDSQDIIVIAKIENTEGVENFDSIIQVADGVMIARGDLGVEVPLSRVPSLQKEMIRKSNLAGKPSVTATQMLESMIHNPRPTRAEVSDVANAIYDSTSAVMLSGETAIGEYPVETVKVMTSIITEAEGDFDYRNFFETHSKLIYHDVPSSVTLATVKTAYSSHAQAIFAFTNQGGTARLIARLRPQMPIIAMTPNVKCFHQMALNWGVIPYFGNNVTSLVDAFAKISEFAVKRKYVTYGDLVVVTAGSPFGISGTTNMMIVENIGDVLVRGHVGAGKRLHGNIKIVFTTESIQPYEVREQIIVIPQCDEHYLPFIQEASGVILQNHIDDEDSETFALNAANELKKSVIVRADAATENLKDGQLITLDPEKALVYKGVVL